MSKLSTREKKLIILLLEQVTYRPASFFAEKLSVSSKTIYKDMKNIETHLGQFELLVEKITRKGLLLQGDSEEKERMKSFVQQNSEMDLQSNMYSPAYRQLFILTDFLLKGEKYTYVEYAERFFISFQSIKKDMDKLCRYLSSFGIETYIQANQVQVIGKESNIQNAYKQYIEKGNFAQTDATMEEIFQGDIIEQVDFFVTRSIQKTGKFQKKNYLKSLKLSLLIFLTRLKQHHHIEEQTDFSLCDIGKTKLHTVALNFSEEMNGKLGCIFYKTDLQYLCWLLLVHGLESEIIHKSKNTEISQVIVELISYISRLLNVDFSKDEQLYDSLIIHIIPMIYRLKNDVYVKNPLKNSVKRQYAIMFTLTQFATSVFERKYQLALNEDEISFLAIHFQLAFEKMKPTKCILIVCENGSTVSELILNRVKQNLPTYVVVEMANAEQISTNSIEGIDLIISAIPLEIKGIPIMHISPLPTVDEISKIAAYLSNMNENEKAFVGLNMMKFISLGKYVKKELIFLNRDFSTKVEVLDFLIDKYEKNKLVTKGFKEGIYKRDALGDTSMYTGVTILHVSPETVLETAISFITMEKSVVWGANSVQLIVTIAIAEKDLGIAKDLVALLYEIIDCKKIIQKAISSNSDDEFLSILKGGDKDVF